MTQENNQYLTPPPQVSGLADDVLTALDEAITIVFDATGSALLAGEKCKPTDRSVIYKRLCEAGRLLEFTVKPALRARPAEPAAGSVPEGWISINDRLPPIGERVLINDGGDVAFGHLSDARPLARSKPENGQHWRGENYDYDGCDGAALSVTEWMPIPATPTAAPSGKGGQ